MFVRYGLPLLVIAGGIVAMAVGDQRGHSAALGGAGIIGAGLSVWLINFLFRIGVSGDRDRAKEDRAREFFDQHGHWPDEPAG